MKSYFKIYIDGYIKRYMKSYFKRYIDGTIGITQIQKNWSRIGQGNDSERASIRWLCQELILSQKELS